MISKLHEKQDHGNIGHYLRGLRILQAYSIISTLLVSYIVKIKNSQAQAMPLATNWTQYYNSQETERTKSKYRNWTSRIYLVDSFDCEMIFLQCMQYFNYAWVNTHIHT